MLCRSNISHRLMSSDCIQSQPRESQSPRHCSALSYISFFSIIFTINWHLFHTYIYKVRLFLISWYNGSENWSVSSESAVYIVSQFSWLWRRCEHIYVSTILSNFVLLVYGLLAQLFLVSFQILVQSPTLTIYILSRSTSSNGLHPNPTGRKSRTVRWWKDCHPKETGQTTAAARASKFAQCVNWMFLSFSGILYSSITNSSIVIFRYKIHILYTFVYSAIWNFMYKHDFLLYFFWKMYGTYYCMLIIFLFQSQFYTEDVATHESIMIFSV